MRGYDGLTGRKNLVSGALVTGSSQIDHAGFDLLAVP